jgi:hypothetical protein
MEFDQTQLKGKLLRRRDAGIGGDNFEETKTTVKLISSQPMIVDEIQQSRGERDSPSFRTSARTNR